ncbi:MAG: S53 family peptidase [Acidobacteria bacterium]|nr:S53 family peptidase [Acidobacteriota bacterium]
MRKIFRGWRLPVALSALVLVGVPAANAQAGTTSPNTLVPVATGLNTQALGAIQVFGSTPASTPETVSFVMRMRNQEQASWYVTHGVRHFLSESQFAQNFGQAPGHLNQLVRYLAAYGIATQVYSDGLDVVANGTAGQFDAALSTSQENVRIPSQTTKSGEVIPAQDVHVNSTDPLLPDYLAQNVLAVLGLTNYGPFTTNVAHAVRSVKAATTSSLDANSCIALTGLPSACHLPSDFVSQYGLSKVASATTGAGSTIGIVTLAALDVGAPETFWSQYANVPTTGRTVTVQNVDGGPGAPSFSAGSGETDLDVEQSGAVAPGANIVVYQAPNSDFGFADAFFTAASQNVADSVSASWGQSETSVMASINQGLESPQYLQAFDEAFLEMGLQGQSSFVSAGDYGAYDALPDVGSTNLAVDTPGSSPYVTVAGGTTLPWSATLTSNSNPAVSAQVNVPTERAWGWDYLWAPFAQLTGTSYTTQALGLLAGGGGGYSTVYSTPAYQQDVPGVNSYTAVNNLTPTQYTTVAGLNLPTSFSVNTSPSVTSGTGSGRNVPDLSTNADPFTGYLEYSPSFADPSNNGGGPLLEGGWGGTSFVAPQLNGSTALIDAYVGHRVGFWNPTIYSAATSDWSPFTPLSTSGPSNDNLYFSGQPGTVYNPSTGLGTPNLSALAQFFRFSDVEGR